MSKRYKFEKPDGLYFITLTVVDWVDVFIRNEYKNILIENLAYCQKNKGLEVLAWSIMTSHAHLIVRAQEGFELQNIFRDFKKFTSKKIVKAIENNPQESRKEMLLKQFKTNEGVRFWQPGNHPIELWSNKVINQKLTYIHQNPVEEGVVFNPEDYMYSSAYDYAGGRGLLDITLIE